MPSGLRFLENGLIIRENFESPAARRNHFDLRVGETLFDLGRQTGGPRLVVSNQAVFDADLHRSDWNFLLTGWRVLLYQFKRFGRADGFQSIDSGCADHVLPEIGFHQLSCQRNRSVFLESNIGAECRSAHD